MGAGAGASGPPGAAAPACDGSEPTDEGTAGGAGSASAPGWAATAAADVPAALGKGVVGAAVGDDAGAVLGALGGPDGAAAGVGEAPPDGAAGAVAGDDGDEAPPCARLDGADGAAAGNGEVTPDVEAGAVAGDDGDEVPPGARPGDADGAVGVGEATPDGAAAAVAGDDGDEVPPGARLDGADGAAAGVDEPVFAAGLPGAGGAGTGVGADGGWPAGPAGACWAWAALSVAAARYTARKYTGAGKRIPLSRMPAGHLSSLPMGREATAVLVRQQPLPPLAAHAGHAVRRQATAFLSFRYPRFLP